MLFLYGVMEEMKGRGKGKMKKGKGNVEKVIGGLYLQC